jgi:hypothetical protein
METDPGVRGAGRARRVVVWGKQGGDGDSFHACRMKDVHGHVCARTTTPGSTRYTRQVCDRHVPGCVGCPAPCGCV